ncbi:hypothetical protein NKG05_12290 [Oerskovia sp. M15]
MEAARPRPRGLHDERGAPRWRELAVVLALAVGAGLAVKVAAETISDETVLLRNIGLLVFPFLAGTSRGSAA